VDGEDTNIADDVVVEEPAGIPPQDANVGEAAAGTGEDTNPTDVADAIRTPPRATVADTGDQIVTRFWGQRPIPAPSTPAARPETARPSVTGSFSADRWIDGTWVPTTNKKPPVSPQPPAPATPSFLDSMMSFGSSALALINTTRNP
jgi:hypothetical protein